MRFYSEEILGHLCYKIANARVNRWPFSHFFIENVFPPDFYIHLTNSLPPPEDYKSGQSNYNGRKFADPTTTGELSFLKSNEFLNAVATPFIPDFKRRFPAQLPNFRQDLRLIMDSENYAIGPHTDAPWKIISLLFYLPTTFDLEPLGTSVYTPKDPNFRCPGGPHHKFEPFTKIFTAPFLPNTCFGFFKTDYSFHGVEPITIPCRRDVLLWNLYEQE